MIHSMTGYGRGEARGTDGRLTVEVRSVNHRFLDIVIRMPKELSALEDRLRSLLQGSVDRGRLDVYVTLEKEGRGRYSLQVDKDLALAYHNALKEIQNELNLAGSVDLEVLAQLPDVLVLEEVQADADQFWPVLESAARQAIAGLVQMRRSEGESLAADMLGRIDVISREVGAVRGRSPVVVEEYRQRLHERIQELLGDGTLDQERLEAEVVYFAERSDVTEELVRLESHLTQFSEATKKGGSVGRKLNFIIQELHREINTVGSKSQDSEIGRSVVEVKSQIEKLREQVQNIE